MCDVSCGIVIEMVFDCSSSMSEELCYEGCWFIWFDVVKMVFVLFVRGDGKDFGGCLLDLIGMIMFV